MSFQRAMDGHWRWAPMSPSPARKRHAGWSATSNPARGKHLQRNVCLPSIRSEPTTFHRTVSHACARRSSPHRPRAGTRNARGFFFSPQLARRYPPGPSGVRQAAPHAISRARGSAPWSRLGLRWRRGRRPGCSSAPAPIRHVLSLHVDARKIRILVLYGPASTEFSCPASPLRPLCEGDGVKECAFKN